MDFLADIVRIYLVRLVADTFYNYRIAKSQHILDDLQKQRNITIEKLKEATKYNSTQQLLEKYGGAPKSKRPTDDADKEGVIGSQKRRDPKDRASLPFTPNRTGIAPPPTANIQRRSPVPLNLSPPPQVARPHTSAGFSPQLPPQPQEPVTVEEPGFHPSAFSAPTYSESRQPRWYDRVLDVLLGEDETMPKNRLVLICQQCRLVNGQAAPGLRTLEELGPWRCGSCGAWNNQDKKLAADILPTESLLSAHARHRSQSLPHHPGQTPVILESPDSADGAWDPVSHPGSVISAVDVGNNSASENNDASGFHASASSEGGFEAEEPSENEELRGGPEPPRRSERRRQRKG